MKFEFNYHPWKNRFLPIIPIYVKYKDKRILTRAYVDSGATLSAFNTEIAEALGMDYTQGKITYPLGTAGHIKAQVVEVILEINGSDVPCKTVFSKELISKFNLIGMHGIFDKFRVTFDNKNKKVIFEEH